MDFDFLLPVFEEPADQGKQFPTPREYNYYRDLKERIYWIDSAINVETLDLVRKIAQWNREDKGIPVEERKPIRLMFHSDGGDLDVCYAAVDVIKSSTTPIIGINAGKAYSSACYMFLACDERYCLPHAQFVAHKGAAGMAGNYAELAASFDAYKQQVAEMTEYLLETTKLSREEIEQHMVTDWWINATEAVECGMADRIVTSLDEIQ